MNDAFYFGVWQQDEAGHHLYTPEGRSIYDPPRWFPLRYQALDQGLFPHGAPHIDGVATLIHINGWTVISFSDRSVDHRPGSNSAFVFKGRLDFQQTCEQCLKIFPSVWTRFKFPIVLREPGPC